MPDNKIFLHEGREKSLLRHHPWVFSKAIEKEDSSLGGGSRVTVYSHEGNFLCHGIYSPNSQIRVRALSFDENTPCDNNLVISRIKTACSLRQKLIERGNDGVRLVASEGDLLPGLIVDKYNEFLVISISS